MAALVIWARCRALTGQQVFGYLFTQAMQQRWLAFVDHVAAGGALSLF